ncbi:MAG TPA: endolytic transglycosylase MltG, partial [Acidimicrobiia bacterium]
MTDMPGGADPDDIPPADAPSATGVPDHGDAAVRNAGSGPGGGGRRGGLTRRGRIVLGVLAILAVMGVGAGAWVLHQVNPGGGPGAKVVVDVEPGTSVATVAARLDSKGVITSARIFRLYLKVTGGAGSIQAGEYELRTNLSMGAARSALKRG